MFDLFHKQVGNYVTTDFQGNDLGSNWQRIKGVMDRFFVPEEIYQKIPKDLSKVRHPGMEKPQINEEIFEELFE